MISNEARPWPRHEGGQARQEVERLEQELGGAVAKGTLELELVHHQAVAVAAQARERSAKRAELGAVMSLAKLWCDHGKHDLAHDVLAPLYDWFTEGHDSGLLREAKVLLDEFS